MSRNYRRLSVFADADKFAKRVYEVTRFFPKEELYGIVSQFRRAALSVPLNIVEGSAKSSEKEFIRYLEIALGSAFESGYLVDFSNDIGLLMLEVADELKSENTKITKKLRALIRKIRSDLS